jgi:hypothetical protein
VQAQGRKILHFSFPQFEARMLRLRATDQSHWRLYKYQWIFDEEPLELTRWETQPVNHGVPGFHSIISADVTYRAIEPVTLEITAFQRRGLPLMRTYTLAATAGDRFVEHVRPHALQGMLFKYAFFSPRGWHLYREESTVTVQPWGAPDEVVARPFGTDDLDKTRDLDRTRDVGGAVTVPRPGGGV